MTKTILTVRKKYEFGRLVVVAPMASFLRQRDPTSVKILILIVCGYDDCGGGLHTGLFNALYMNLIDCNAAMPPIARRYRALPTFSVRLKRRMLAANERILTNTPGFFRIREASSAKLQSRM